MTTSQLPLRYALIMDPSAIRKVLKKIESLNLPRRECHPLDRYTGRKANLELAKFDAEIDRDSGSVDFDDVDDAHHTGVDHGERLDASEADWETSPRH